MNYLSPDSHASSAMPTVLPAWRLRSGENLAALSWLVAISATFLAIGCAGMVSGLGPEPVLMSFQPPSKDLDSASDSSLLAELVSDTAPADPPSNPEVLEVPPPVEATPQVLDLPELADALTTEDVFSIPVAPKIDPALTPLDPVAPKPVVKRTSSAPPSTQSRSTAGSTQGSGGGNSGSGSGGSGSGSFSIPRPTYPSTLRAMGVQGTVKLRVVVGTSGRASSVTVVGTSGNSTLDQYAANWVRRNGKAPPGEVRTVIAPLSFVLR